MNRPIPRRIHVAGVRPRTLDAAQATLDERPRELKPIESTQLRETLRQTARARHTFAHG